MIVAEIDALQHLPHAAPHHVLVQAVGVALKLIQDGVVHELKDQVQALLAAEDLNQVDQILVPQLLKSSQERK